MTTNSKGQSLELFFILCKEGDYFIFQEDYVFKSPSAAAAIVRGRVANGRKGWKIKNTDKTYGEWENEKLQQIEAERYN